MEFGDDLAGLTIADVLRRNVSERPKAEALALGETRLDWTQTHDAALRIAAWLYSRGVRRGDRVAAVLGNVLEFPLLVWACALGGTVLVPISPRLRADELRYILHHSGARFAFVPEPTEEFSHPLAIRGMNLKDLQGTVVVESGGSFGARTAGAQTPSGFIDFRDLLAVSPRPPETAVERSDLFGIVYTSGTTGVPKGVGLTHGNLVWDAGMMAKTLGITTRDALLVAVPVTHIFGISACLLTAACAGARCVLVKSFAAGPVLDIVEQETITILHGNPTMFLLEVAAQQRAPRDLSSLRTGIVAAAQVDPALARSIRSQLSCNIQIAYGLTETSPCLTITRDEDPEVARSESVGRPLPEIELRLDDEVGGVGEICVRGPCVFKGYFSAPEMTREAFTPDGWFRTGDLGSIDDGGFIRLAGRKKELIIRGGLHVYPAEIELALLAIPWITEAAVIGLPDPVMGERTCACIITRDAPPNVQEAVRSILGKSLADFKLPDMVLRFDALPLTPSGKVQRFVLRDQVLAQRLNVP